MIYVFYFVVTLYSVAVFGGLAVSWLILRFGTYGPELGYVSVTPIGKSQ